MDLQNVQSRKDADQFIKDVLIQVKQGKPLEEGFQDLKDLLTLVTNKLRGKRPEQSLDEEITELSREFHLRGKVYPDLILAGKLRKRQAEEQNRRLLSAIDRLKTLRAERVGEQGALFLG